MINKFSRIFFAFIFMFFCLILPGCSSKNNLEKTYSLPYKINGFSTKATVDLNGKKYTSDITKKGEASYEFHFTSPDSLKSISIAKNGEDLYISCNGLEIPINKKSSIYSQLFDVFELTEADITFSGTKELNGTVIPYADFNSDQRTVRIFFSKATGLPLRIEGVFCGLPVVVNLSQFKVN